MPKKTISGKRIARKHTYLTGVNWEKTNALHTGDKNCNNW